MIDNLGRRWLHSECVGLGTLTENQLINMETVVCPYCTAYLDGTNEHHLYSKGKRLLRQLTLPLESTSTKSSNLEIVEFSQPHDVWGFLPSNSRMNQVNKVNHFKISHLAIDFDEISIPKVKEYQYVNQDFPKWVKNSVVNSISNSKSPRSPSNHIMSSKNSIRLSSTSDNSLIDSNYSTNLLIGIHGKSRGSKRSNQSLTTPSALPQGILQHRLFQGFLPVGSTSITNTSSERNDFNIIAAQEAVKILSEQNELESVQYAKSVEDAKTSPEDYDISVLPSQRVRYARHESGQRLSVYLGGSSTLYPVNYKHSFEEIESSSAVSFGRSDPEKDAFKDRVIHKRSKLLQNSFIVPSSLPANISTSINSNGSSNSPKNTFFSSLGYKYKRKIINNSILRSSAAKRQAADSKYVYLPLDTGGFRMTALNPTNVLSTYSCKSLHMYCVNEIVCAMCLEPLHLNDEINIGNNIALTDKLDPLPKFGAKELNNKSLYLAQINQSDDQPVKKLKSSDINLAIKRMQEEIISNKNVDFNEASNVSSSRHRSKRKRTSRKEKSSKSSNLLSSFIQNQIQLLESIGYENFEDDGIHDDIASEVYANVNGELVEQKVYDRTTTLSDSVEDFEYAINTNTESDALFTDTESIGTSSFTNKASTSNISFFHSSIDTNPNNLPKFSNVNDESQIVHSMNSPGAEVSEHPKGLISRSFGVIKYNIHKHCDKSPEHALRFTISGIDHPSIISNMSNPESFCNKCADNSSTLPVSNSANITPADSANKQQSMLNGVCTQTHFTQVSNISLKDVSSYLPSCDESTPISATMFNNGDKNNNSDFVVLTDTLSQSDLTHSQPSSENNNSSNIYNGISFSSTYYNYEVVDDAICDLCGRSGGAMLYFQINNHSPCETSQLSNSKIESNKHNVSTIEGYFTTIPAPSSEGWLGHLPCIYWLRLSRMLVHSPLIRNENSAVLTDLEYSNGTSTFKQSGSSSSELTNDIVLKSNIEGNVKIINCESDHSAVDVLVNTLQSSAAESNESLIIFDSDSNQKSHPLESESLSTSTSDYNCVSDKSSQIFSDESKLVASFDQMSTNPECDTTDVAVETVSSSSIYDKQYDISTQGQEYESSSSVHEVPDRTSVADDGVNHSSKSFNYEMIEPVDTVNNKNTVPNICSMNNDYSSQQYNSGFDVTRRDSSTESTNESQFDVVYGKFPCALCGLCTGLTLRCSSYACYVRAHPLCMSMAKHLNWSIYSNISNQILDNVTNNVNHNFERLVCLCPQHLLQ